MRRSAATLLKNNGIVYDPKNSIFGLSDEPTGVVDRRAAAIDSEMIQREGFKPLTRGETIQ